MNDRNRDSGVPTPTDAAGAPNSGRPQREAAGSAGTSWCDSCSSSPPIFILVTMVFLLMRTIGDPITAALGGRLTADQIAGTHPRGRLRPARSSCSTSSTWARSSPATSAPPSATTGRSPKSCSPTARPPSSWRSTRSSSRSSSASRSACSPPTCATAAGCGAAGLRDPLLRHPGLLRRPAAQARRSPSGWTGCPWPAEHPPAPSSTCNSARIRRAST